MEKKGLVTILIAKSNDPELAKISQYRYYQKDGQTVAVAIGRKQEVPLWVAEIAKEVGDIDDF